MHPLALFVRSRACMQARNGSQKVRLYGGNNGDLNGRKVSRTQGNGKYFLIFIGTVWLSALIIKDKKLNERPVVTEKPEKPGSCQNLKGRYGL